MQHYLKTIKEAHQYLLVEYNKGQLRAKPLMEDLGRVIDDIESYKETVTS